MSATHEHEHDSRIKPFKIERHKEFSRSGPDTWRYTHSDSPQKLWMIVVDAPGDTSGLTFAGGVSLRSDRAMVVSVSLARYGDTEYEGVARRVELEPDTPQTIRLVKTFDRTHTALKVQLDIQEMPDGGSASLHIEGLYLHETLESVLRRVGEEGVDLREANRLFREGDAFTALGLYLLLHRRRSFAMYGENALLAASKMGMASPDTTLEELLHRVESNA